MTLAAPAAQKPNPRKAKTARTLRLLNWNPAARNGLLEITEGKAITGYALRSIEPGYCERAFRVEKMFVLGGKLTVEGVHHVGVERKGHHCDCKGFERHSNCKHASAVLKLLELGKI